MFADERTSQVPARQARILSVCTTDVTITKEVASGENQRCAQLDIGFQDFHEIARS
jgi:hypothetical protein